ncbi:MAG: DUF6268 family outer membrane beta-barrel protein [Flavobacteriaceae bacterium]|nr:DUF6268 family outer membrane beta-barrel protein [Flavobacteriaceae bacterium]
MARIEYSSLPDSKSETESRRYRILINAPIKTGLDEYMVLGGDYSNIEIRPRNPLPFDASSLRTLHVIDFNMGYIFKWNENWRFVGIFSPRIASNLESTIVPNDFKVNATATLWKDRKDAEKPFRLVLGLSYNSATGLPIPLPLINYYRRFHPKWSYTLGIPKSQFRYYLSEKHIFDASLFLDGYFVNIQNEIPVPDDKIANAISLSLVVGSIGYQFKISKYVSWQSWIGHSIIQKGVLRDNDRNKVFEINSDPGFYFRSGIKMSIF